VTEAVQAYPLAWPEGWPRFKGARDSDRRFAGGDTYEGWGDQRRYVGRKAPTVYRANRSLKDELARLGAKNIVVSTNLELRQDGEPYSNRRAPADPGVAVYFSHKGKQLVMAQDRFDSVAGNMRSLGLAVEALRQLERHGGGTMMERAFQGFAAITPPSWKKPWREVFGLKDVAPKDIQRDLIDKLYRIKARDRHPDTGGSDTLMAELNLAYEEAKAEMGP
jgi:hypothetical protein